MPIDNRDFTLLRSLHGVALSDADLQRVEGKGWGIVCTRDLTTEEDHEVPSLMSIPDDLVLNTTAVETYAKESHNFRELYDAVGPKVWKEAISIHTLGTQSTSDIISCNRAADMTSCCFSWFN
jgi:hypothetical protein